MKINLKLDLPKIDPLTKKPFNGKGAYFGLVSGLTSPILCSYSLHTIKTLQEYLGGVIVDEKGKKI